MHNRYAEYDAVLHRDGTVTFRTPPPVCRCGHPMSDHAHTQGRPFWPCEHPDCDCNDHANTVSAR